MILSRTAGLRQAVNTKSQVLGVPSAECNHARLLVFEKAADSHSLSASCDAECINSAEVHFQLAASESCLCRWLHEFLYSLVET